MWELSCNHSIRGGFSGVETLGEVQEMIRRTLKFYPSIQSEDIRTILVHRGDRILPELSARLSGRETTEVHNEAGCVPDWSQRGKCITSAHTEWTGSSVW